MPPRRHALTDPQWNRIAHLFERPRRPGRQWKDHRLMLDGILWVMKTGAPWRDLPERFGPWKTVYERFRRWRREGLLDRVVAQLQRDLDREGLIDWSAFCLDATHVRASRSAAGARKRGSRPAVPTARAASRTSRRIMRWGGHVAALRTSFTS